VHRFLSPQTAACFEGVTVDQVRADLAEITITGYWEIRPVWVQRVYDHHAVASGGMNAHAGIAVDAGLRFIIDNERREIAERLRELIPDDPEVIADAPHVTTEAIEDLADELDPED
jgi:predicted amidohydrolase YtcJ